MWEKNIWRGIAIGLMILTLVVISPFVVSLFRFFDPTIINDPYNQFLNTALRSLTYGLASSLALLLFGFCGALLLYNVPFFSRLGKSLAILILPVTLGNVSIAFITKLLLSNSSLFSSFVASSISWKLLFLGVLQLWQFGLLFVYLFWMNLQAIPKTTIDYANATQFSFYQKLKDIFLPSSLNLAILLAVLGFIFSVFEESKIQYLFKASRGTDSELITTWLTRNYNSALLISPENAKAIAFNASYIISLGCILALVGLFTIIYSSNRVFTKSKLYLSTIKISASISKVLNVISKAWAIMLIVLVLAPLTFSLLKIDFAISDTIHTLGFSLLMVTIATFAATFFAIVFAIAARLGWHILLSSFSQRSLAFINALFMLLLIPPLVILISGYNLMGIIGYGSEITIYLIWIAGHTILTLPVLGSFTLFNHFRVSNNELSYLSVYKINSFKHLWDFINYSFLKRFRAEYLLLFIIAFSFIWNEAILNNLFSDYVPSFVSGLKMLITGRGADYSQAFGYLLVSIIIAVLSVVTWRYIIEQAAKQEQFQ